jgi:hypothetical protein
MKKILLTSLFASTVFASYMGSTQTTVTGSGLGNVVSINGDSSALQTIAGSNNISASTAGGTTTINGTLLAPKANPTFTGTIGTPLTASRAVVTDGSGNLSASSATSTVLGYLDIGSSLTTLLAAKVTQTGFVESYSGHIETASDKTYVLDHYAAYAKQITNIRIKCTSGSITAALKIGGTNITTCNGISVTTSSATTTCDVGATNDLAANGELTLVTSANSSCTDLIFTVKTTRD